MSKPQKERGQSLIETVVGVLVLIPIVLLAVDASFLLSANRSNQELAHNVARAAANKTDPTAAEESATNAVTGFERTKVIKDVQLTEFDFNKQTKTVKVSTSMDVEIPITAPGVRYVKLSAHWTEPIVAIPAKF